MATNPGDVIRDRIRTDGPITFATYMELALYGAGGFYEEPPVGTDGDFVTSPHVHPAFGMFVARALRLLADALGAPEPLRISEVGAGDGTLARQILAEIDADYTAVDVSPGARRALREIDGLEVRDRLDGSRHLVVAHELLDNLPFRLVRDDEEICIDLGEDGSLRERPTPIDGAFRAMLGDHDTVGELVVPTGAFAFLGDVGNVLPAGYALLIDYGTDAGSGGSLHGYRSHHVVEDILREPGATDITAGVDFGWISRHAESSGLRAFPSVNQHDALFALGFEPWLREERTRQQELLAGGQGLEAVRTWSMRSRATMLVDPDGLGRLRWLVLAADDLPEPGWLREALDRRTD